MAKRRRFGGLRRAAASARERIVRVYQGPSRVASAARRAAPVAKRGGMGLLAMARRHAGASVGGIMGAVTDVAVGNSDTPKDDAVATALKLGGSVGMDYLGGDFRNASLGLTGQTIGKLAVEYTTSPEVRAKAQAARERILAERKAATPPAR